MTKSAQAEILVIPKSRNDSCRKSNLLAAAQFTQFDRECVHDISQDREWCEEREKGGRYNLTCIMRLLCLSGQLRKFS